MSKLTPKFKKPPVDEVVTGFDFVAPQDITSIDLAELKSLYKPLGFSKYEEHFPIAPRLPDIIIPNFGMPSNAPSRLWFISNDSNYIIQVQRNKFLVNWRKYHNPNIDYPSYKEHQNEFWKCADVFMAWFKKRWGNDISISAQEMSYLNTIPTIPEKEINPSDYFTDMKWTPKDHLGNIVQLNSEFLVNMDKKSRMHIVISSGFRASDSNPIFRLEMNMLGSNKFNMEQKTLSEWYDYAHESIVFGFCEITTKEMHEKWEKCQ